ncbi:unnamed protein product [Tuber melanosporum]|uniref:(Perigord truffle) hypothetical protein n=1 Tax=Tuber melanosporum (strain Mel28) TaxID=656061 RepID=D5GJU2_TUBMM|nr:uncharacterized protein GSTUM_00009195001 [Tuber melanosporum]CAZ84785.1 unnamed protein product [Tuber melanosporum]
MGTSILPSGDPRWNRTPIRPGFFVFILITILNAGICIAETAKRSHVMGVLVLTVSLVTTVHLAIDMYLFFVKGRLHGISVFLLFFAEFCLWMVVAVSEAMDLGFLSKPKGWFNTDGPFPECGFGDNMVNGGICELMRARFFISLAILIFSFAFTLFSALGPAPETRPISSLMESGDGEGGEGAQRCSDQEQVQPPNMDKAQPVVEVA